MKHFNFPSPLWWIKLIKVSQSERVESIIHNHLLSLGKVFLIYFPEIWETKCLWWLSNISFSKSYSFHLISLANLKDDLIKLSGNRWVKIITYYFWKIIQKSSKDWMALLLYNSFLFCYSFIWIIFLSTFICKNEKE